MNQMQLKTLCKSVLSAKPAGKKTSQVIFFRKKFILKPSQKQPLKADFTFLNVKI